MKSLEQVIETYLDGDTILRLGSQVQWTGQHF